MFYQKWDDFNFHITKFPFLSSNIPSSPAYGVFIPQVIRYAQAGSSYEFFILRANRLSVKLLKQGYLVERLNSWTRKFYAWYGDIILQYEVFLLNDNVTLGKLQWLRTDKTLHQFHDLDTELDLHRITSGFNGACVTGLACQQGMLTLPDTWFRPPFWDLLVIQLLTQVFPNLPCLFSTLHFAYPSVLSRFWWGWVHIYTRVFFFFAFNSHCNQNVACFGFVLVWDQPRYQYCSYLIGCRLPYILCTMS